MNGTQIPKDFNNIKSKFQKIDEANKRRLEIIKNKDKIEKSVSEIETIYEKVKNLDKMDLEKFLKEKPEQFLQNFDTKIDEIEKRRTGLKIVQEMANERIELLQLFPDLLESEKGKEIRKKVESINNEIDKCENIKLEINELKDKYEKKAKIEEQYQKVVESYKETRLISVELMDYNFTNKEMDSEFFENIDEHIDELEEKIKKLTRMSNEMYVIINEVLPKSKHDECVELYEYVDGIKSLSIKIKEKLEELIQERYRKILNNLEEISNSIKILDKEINDQVELEKEYKQVIPLFNQFVKGKTIEISIKGRPREILNNLIEIYEEKNKVFNEVKSKKISIEESSELYNPLIRKLEILKEKNVKLENLMKELSDMGADHVDFFVIKNLIKEIDEQHNNYVGKKMLNESYKITNGTLNVTYNALKIFAASEVLMGIYAYAAEKSFALYNGTLFIVGILALAVVQIFDKDIYNYLEKRNKK